MRVACSDTPSTYALHAAARLLVPGWFGGGSHNAPFSGIIDTRAKDICSDLMMELKDYHWNPILEQRILAVSGLARIVFRYALAIIDLYNLMTKL
ncbi:hypothetical protein EVAR_48217_1 [Eumeta japonica]|uniref:Uncharacterized protein n=1 Tax=Eumeta variegata TaxID=151549 RepID=A0A4C1XX18_EUMVA|nr:hypothetical protein EVAR_48217_1 [Eumeta japonica]